MHFKANANVLSIAALAGFLFMAAAPASAQWLKYPTAGVPRTPSGLSNLGAPTPRTADGKPDLSGMWEAENTLRIQGVERMDNPTDLAIGAQFLNIAAGLEGGLPYQPWAAALYKQRAAGGGKDYPHTKCMPPGVPEIHSQSEYRKYVQTSGLLLILTEFDANFRQVFTDGRPLPISPRPSYHGYSSGHWEGDTLVVQSNGFRDGTWIDLTGNVMTDAAKVTERFHRLNYGNMVIEVTVDDPKAYTRPWTVKLNQYVVLNTEMLDYICWENEKDVPHLVGN